MKSKQVPKLALKLPPPPAPPRVIKEDKVPIQSSLFLNKPIYKSKSITKGIEKPLLPKNLKEKEQQFLKGLFLIVYIMILIILITEICQ